MPHRRLVVLLGALSAVPALAIDVYLPAMPSMADELRVPAGQVQVTLTVFLVGLAVGQLLVGPLSDARGRRRPLLGGLLAFVVGSVACLLAPDLGWLVAARALQALGAAAAVVLARAIVRDCFAGERMTRFFSVLMAVNGVATVAAPVLGGQLLTVAGWRAAFAVLAGLGVVLLVAVALLLPESLPVADRVPAGLRRSLVTYGALLANRDYLRHALCAALLFGAMFSYLAGSPFVLQRQHGLDAQQYAVVFAVNAVGIAVLAHVNALLVGRVASAERLLGCGLAAAAAGGAGVLVAVVADLPLPVLLLALFVVVSAVGPVTANATALALAAQDRSTGAAASLQGVLQYAVGGLVVAVSSVAAGTHHAAAAGTTTSLAMAVTVAVAAAVALAVFRILRPRAGAAAGPVRLPAAPRSSVGAGAR